MIKSLFFVIYKMGSILLLKKFNFSFGIVEGFFLFLNKMYKGMVLKYLIFFEYIFFNLKCFFLFKFIK